MLCSGFFPFEEEETSMRRRYWGLLGALVALAVGLAAFAGTTAASRSAKPPIIIGAAMDFSGQMSPFNNPALTAAQLEAKKINAKGRADGRPTRILTGATQNPQPAVSTACASHPLCHGAVTGP